MTDDLLARVAAIAAREAEREIVESATGAAFGRSIPYRRDGRPLPPIPGADQT